MEFSLAGRSTSRWQSTANDRDSTETEPEPDGKDAGRKGGQGRQAGRLALMLVGRLGGRPETAAYGEHSHSIACRAWQQEAYMVFEGRQYSQSRRSRMGTVPPNSLHEHHIASCREATRLAFACYVAQCHSVRPTVRHARSPGSERRLKRRPCEAEKEGSSSQPGQAKAKANERHEDQTEPGWRIRRPKAGRH